MKWYFYETWYRTYMTFFTQLIIQTEVMAKNSSTVWGVHLLFNSMPISNIYIYHIPLLIWLENNSPPTLRLHLVFKWNIVFNLNLLILSIIFNINIFSYFSLRNIILYFQHEICSPIIAQIKIQNCNWFSLIRKGIIIILKKNRSINLKLFFRSGLSQVILWKLRFFFLT